MLPADPAKSEAAFYVRPLEGCPPALPVGSRATTVYPYAPMRPTTPQQRRTRPLISILESKKISTTWRLIKLLHCKSSLLGMESTHRGWCFVFDGLTACVVDESTCDVP